MFCIVATQRINKDKFNMELNTTSEKLRRPMASLPIWSSLMVKRKPLIFHYKIQCAYTATFYPNLNPITTQKMLHVYVVM